ncbi:hypothetical protein [Algibacter lectus]|uniref:hypothetical protein n=1 Tax=Algibacter lectus TaxID=221126 RepID=UPI0026EA7D8A|nr:hypothetical protein [Algibacter lectus]MDO7135924.1 hypothetical protein [Algibacter lectus]
MYFTTIKQLLFKINNSKTDSEYDDNLEALYHYGDVIKEIDMDDLNSIISLYPEKITDPNIGYGLLRIVEKYYGYDSDYRQSISKCKNNEWRELLLFKLNNN